MSSSPEPYSTRLGFLRKLLPLGVQGESNTPWCRCSTLDRLRIAVRIEDGEAGLSARTIKRRLASVTGLFEYLIIRGVVAKNPVPQGLSTRSPNRGGPGGR